MGTYKQGRPKEIDPFNEMDKIPKKPGEYRKIEKTGSQMRENNYIGETNNLHRRIGEHKRTGKIKPGEKIAIQVADGRSTSNTRREHEKEKIAKHKPIENKSSGGEGRKAKKK